MICAIDPGASGAIAFMSDEGHLIEVCDLPTAQVKVGKTMRTRLLPAVLAAMVKARNPVVAWIEEVDAMGTNGSVSNFNLGKSFGQIEGVMAGIGVAVKTVRPKVWQKHFRLMHGDKGASRLCAIRLWPGAAQQFARVKDDGRAEACLIGLYGANSMQGMGSVAA